MPQTDDVQPPFEFDTATAVRRGEGGVLLADLDQTWQVGGGILNGGYLLSVAARAGTDPWALAYNPSPPVEFGAAGIEVDVAWSGGGGIVATGNSFAAAHVTGMVAAMLGKHPWLTPFQVKTVLQALSENAVTQR